MKKARPFANKKIFPAFNKNTPAFNSIFKQI